MIFQESIKLTFIALRQLGSLEAMVKQVGSVRPEILEAVAARRAFGSGYRVVPSVGCFGLKMRFLDRVSMGVWGWEG
jgi:hypothetical protein